jgi:hypothetical protein
MGQKEAPGKLRRLLPSHCVPFLFSVSISSERPRGFLRGTLGSLFPGLGFARVRRPRLRNSTHLLSGCHLEDYQVRKELRIARYSGQASSALSGLDDLELVRDAD